MGEVRCLEYRKIDNNGGVALLEEEYPERKYKFWRARVASIDNYFSQDYPLDAFEDIDELESIVRHTRFTKECMEYYLNIVSNKLL